MSRNGTGSPNSPDAEGFYRAPRDCPVCSEGLHTIRLGCSNCGTELSGAFASCEFCGLDDADRALLKVFLVSRGTMREVERHLGVSYPTARARFDELLARLGYRASATTPAPPDPPSAPATPPAASDARLVTLQALARGELDVETARTQLHPGDEM